MSRYMHLALVLMHTYNTQSLIQSTLGKGGDRHCHVTPLLNSVCAWFVCGPVRGGWGVRINQVLSRREDKNLPVREKLTTTTYVPA